MSANSQNKGAGNWTVAGPNASAPSALTDLVMAWAKDSETGEPRYIFELDATKRGAKCGCECYSCGLSLTAVNAGKTVWRRRPHFRHPDGAQKNACLILSARAAALETLRIHGVLTLPSRRMGATITGLSGKKYTAWISSPPEPVRISTFKTIDQVRAILTLADGRQLKVSLTGKVDGEQSGGIPTIVLTIDDPTIAAMSPDDLKSRLHLLVEQASWCGHWSDPDLKAQATQQAQRDAEHSLDWLENLEQSDVPGTRESLLHSLAKEVLAQAGRIRLPKLSAYVDIVLPSGDVEYRTSILPGVEVKLGNVLLEEKLGNIRPDVLAEIIPSDLSSEANNPLMQGPLLIEVTVTNGIDEEREKRIKSRALPALEVDLSILGGTLSKEDFIRLLVEEEAGKRWVHHPWLTSEIARLEAELASLRAALDTPLDELGKQYLEAVIRHSQAKIANESKTVLSETKGEVERYAEVLAAHGYPEAMDLELWSYQGNILCRLLSIRHDKVFGYRLNTTWQVLNAILCETEPYTIWQPLYLAALRTYRPPLLEQHAERVERWRLQVRQSLEAGENKFRHDGRYNKLVSLLFPEMAALLRIPLPRGSSAELLIYNNPIDDDSKRSGISDDSLLRDRIWRASLPSKENVAAAAHSLAKKRGISEQRVMGLAATIYSRAQLGALTPEDLAIQWSIELGVDETDMAAFLIEAGYVLKLVDRFSNISNA